jgi:hypothetical protein
MNELLSQAIQNCVGNSPSDLILIDHLPRSGRDDLYCVTLLIVIKGVVLISLLVRWRSTDCYCPPM